MLSKSAARAFFLTGTFLCSAVFIALTVDTFRRIPAQTHADAITPAVARGKDLWDTSNCMGCHTLLGEGAYYAPELTRVVSRRGESFVRAMLKDPESMYPGQRRMQNYQFTDAQIDDLVAFLRWVDGMDLNGFPPTPTISASAVTAAAAASRRPAEFDRTCIACHAVEGRGGQVGPALDGIADRRDADFLRRWLRDPFAIKANSRMPNLHLDDASVEEIVTYLGTLGTRGQP